MDQMLLKNSSDWFVRETVGYLRRVFSRLDVSSRSIFAIVEPGSCFAGTLAELLLAADRSFMLDAENGPSLAFSEMNYGSYPMASGFPRLHAHYCGDVPALPLNEKIPTAKASELGLVTFAPDDIDWDDEVRLAVEGRTSLSPDALTGMEANLRFAGPETMETKIFGRLTAWQNWIFIRPNAVGEKGALTSYGSQSRPEFDFNRT